MRNGAAFRVRFSIGSLCSYLLQGSQGFSDYGGIFFHSVPTKRGSAGACSGSTSLQFPLFVRLAFWWCYLNVSQFPQSKLHLKSRMVCVYFGVAGFHEMPHSVYQITTRLAKHVRRQRGSTHDSDAARRTNVGMFPPRFLFNFIIQYAQQIRPNRAECAITRRLI